MNIQEMNSSTVHKVGFDEVWNDFYDPQKRELRRIQKNREQRINNLKKEYSL